MSKETEEPTEESTEPEVMLHDGRKVTFEDLSPREGWAVLARVPLERADFQRRDYVGFDLAGLNLKHVNMTACDFSRASLIRAVLEGINADGALFVGARLDGADMTSANIPDADFSNAKLQGATFNNCNALGSTFDKADLRKAVFRGKPRFASTSLEGANLSNVVFGDADLSGACLDGADLSGAQLDDANFTSASMRGVCLHKAVLRGTNLANADLSGADLRGLTHEGHNFCNFTGMQLDGATDIPTALHEWGLLNELEPLLRRADYNYPKDGSLTPRDMETALRKLWLDRAASGSDFLLEPTTKLMDAAYALAIAIAAQRPKSRY